MNVDEVDGEALLGGVTEELCEPGEAGAGIGDGGGAEEDAAGEGLDEGTVGCEGLRDGHAAGEATEAGVGFVEAEDGVGAVVGNGVVYISGPDGGEGAVVVEEKRVEFYGVLVGVWIGADVVGASVG